MFETSSRNWHLLGALASTGELRFKAHDISKRSQQGQMEILRKG